MSSGDQSESEETNSSSLDLDLSYSSSEFDFEGSHNESVNIRPFMFEPEVSAESSGNSSSSSEDENEDIARLSNTDWCSCGACVAMPTVVECICCSEIDVMQEKKMEVEGLEVESSDCITDHPGFESVCLDMYVLQTAYFSLRQHYGSKAPQGTLQQQYRHTAYRQLVSWCWGWVGKNIRVPLPACAVTKIRNSFPSADYAGFKYPSLK